MLLIFLAFVVALNCWLFSTCVYPSLFGPLRHIPHLRADWRFRTYQWLYTEPHPRQIDEWLKNTNHEGLVRYDGMLGAPRVLVLGPDAVKEVLVTKAYGGQFERSALNRQRIGTLFGDGLLVSEGEVHKAQRKQLLPAFALRNIKELYPVFWSKACELTESISKAINAQKSAKHVSPDVIELVRFVSLAALDIIGVAAWGKDFEAIRKPQSEFVVRYHRIFRGSPKANQQARLIHAAALAIPIGTLRRLFPCEFFDNLTHGVRAIRTAVQQAISQKHELKVDDELAEVRQDGARQDILSHAMTNFDDKALQGQMMNLLAAGHETTSLTATWTCFLLCKHPEVQTRLREEIRANLPSPSSSEMVTYDMLENLPFLRAVLREAQRIYPVVFLVRREAMRDTSISGYAIPKGTGIVVSAWHVNRNRSEWGADAEEFKVSRWLPDKDHDVREGGSTKVKTVEDLVSSHFAYLPFMAGPRSCIGEGFAKGELLAMIAALIGKFEMSLENNNPDYEPDVMWGITAKPLNLKFKLQVLENW